jgi:hypothetical protein
MTTARDELRQRILASRKPKSELVSFFGDSIELRQPTLHDILKIRQASEDERNAAIINTLVDYAYVPGTDEKLFEEADADAFLAMPFGADFQRVTEVLSKLTDIDFKASDATSKPTT